MLLVVRLCELLRGCVHQKVVKLDHDKKGGEVHDLTNHCRFFRFSRENLKDDNTKADVAHDLPRIIGVIQEFAYFFRVNEVSGHRYAVLLCVKQKLSKHDKHNS